MTGATLNVTTPVLGSVLSAEVKSWKLELGIGEPGQDVREIGRGRARGGGWDLTSSESR